MSGVRISLTGADEALRVLGEAVAKAAAPRGLFDRIGAALVTSTQERFERESGPDGSPWPQSLRAKLEGGRTLTQTGRLVASLTHNASDAGVEVGTGVVYAAIHQLGGTIKAKTSVGLRFRTPGNGQWVTKQQVTIPARPFLGLDEEDEVEIGRLAAEWLGAEDEGGGDARV